MAPPLSMRYHSCAPAPSDVGCRSGGTPSGPRRGRILDASVQDPGDKVALGLPTRGPRLTAHAVGSDPLDTEDVPRSRVPRDDTVPDGHPVPLAPSSGETTSVRRRRTAHAPEQTSELWVAPADTVHPRRGRVPGVATVGVLHTEPRRRLPRRHGTPQAGEPDPSRRAPVARPLLEAGDEEGAETQYFRRARGPSAQKRSLTTRADPDRDGVRT